MKKTFLLSILALALLLTGCAAALAAPVNTAAEIKANSGWAQTEGDWPADATVDGVLDVLTYSDETCDGIPKYYYTAEDGTEYAFNFGEQGGWVRKNGEQEATVDDETARFLLENAGTLRCEVGTTPAAAVGYTESDRLIRGALNAQATTKEAGRVRLPLYRLDTKADADKFLTDYADLLQMDYEKDGAFPSLRQILASYDEGFYANNSLMLVTLTASSGSDRFGIVQVSLTEGAFQLLAARVNDYEVGTCDMAGWALLYEIADGDVNACTAFDAWYVMDE